MTTPLPTDWAEIRQRITAIQTAIDHGFAHSPEEEREILKTRAQLLGRSLDTGSAVGETLEVVEFELASERYAFPLTDVREVSLLRELTPVPCTPPFVVGIINLRGEIRTVIDLKTFFDLPASGITDLNKIILIQHGALQFGILADAIRGVVSLPLGELQPALPTLTDRRADYVRGITPDRLVVLEPMKILSDPRILVDDEATS
jgi:purine-binding chemotaxis protein CheW